MYFAGNTRILAAYLILPIIMIFLTPISFNLSNMIELKGMIIIEIGFLIFIIIYSLTRTFALFMKQYVSSLDLALPLFPNEAERMNVFSTSFLVIFLFSKNRFSFFFFSKPYILVKSF